ncbi:ABC transporter permease [Bailinhaonella thermotolerans]|nr:ABC transporter permease [Bailinhaonella thermotolerans]
MTANGRLPAWTGIRLVARRELVERLRQRSFMVSTLVTLLILVGVAVLPAVIGGDGTHRVGFGPGESRLAEAVTGAAGQQREDVRARSVPSEAAARAEVSGGDLDAAVVNGRVIVRSELDPVLGALLQGAHARTAAEQRVESLGVAPDKAREALSPPPLQVTALDPPDPGADARKGVAFFAVILLYGQIIGYGMWVAMGVVEEKSSRVVELLLATMRARVLLAGKVLGIGLLGLIQLVLVIAVGLVAVRLTGSVDLPLGVLGGSAFTLVGWFLLGYLLYACLFATGAARVSRQEELQSVTGPMMMLVMVSFFGALWAMNAPDNMIARVLGIIPPFSAMIQPVRQVAGYADPWEAPVALALAAAAVAGLMVLAGRIYEGGVLRMGGTVSFKEALGGRESRSVRP